MSEPAVLHDPRLGLGGNKPPNDSPFDAVKDHIEDLLVEARAWADGAKVESQPQADEISRLIEDLRLGAKAADEARIVENKPFDEGKAAVQAKYAPLIADPKTKKPGAVWVAIDALKATLKPWLDELDRQLRAEAERKRLEAEEASRKAAEAARAAAPEDLSAREQAEDLIDAAAKAEAEARRAEGAKAHALGGSRALGLKRDYRPVMTDRKAALLHYLSTRPDEVVAFLQALAEADVRNGKRQIPGFDVVESTRL